MNGPSPYVTIWKQECKNSHRNYYTNTDGKCIYLVLGPSLVFFILGIFMPSTMGSAKVFTCFSLIDIAAIQNIIKKARL